MADTTRRSSSGTSSSNKLRKSKNEIIRTTLGIYLKQRNYTPSEKFRKSDLSLTQSMKQTEFNMMVEDDVSKVNSFMYSNVLCLNNNPGIVDQQFSKFNTFVQSQNATIKTELQAIINPLLCYLYIELLKGKDTQPAVDFLKKFAHLVGPIDCLTSNLPNKVNGKNVPVVSEDAATSTTVPSSSTQITFLREPENEPNNPQEFFKELIQALSSCLRIDELDAMDITRNFHYSKHELELSLNSVYALKNYLIRNGHVMVLHILQTWFAIEISDTKNGDQLSDNEMLVAADHIQEPEVIFKKPLPAPGTHNVAAAPVEERQINVKLKSLRTAVRQMNTHEKPMRVFNVLNSDNRLTCADVDPLDCHVACAFDDSTVKLWPINQSSIKGRKPYASHMRRTCPWSLDNDYLDLSSTDDESGDDAEDLDVPRMRCKRDRLNRLIKEEHEDDEDEQLVSECGEHILRGHSRGVTGVLFSKQQSLLISVSKDTTMRAWASNTYSSVAVYTGHNYPIWCVAESTAGTYLATGSKDLTARLWSTDREFPLQTYIGHTQDVDTISFHPNGNYIATGSTDLTVRLWCVTSGKLFRVFTDSHLPVQCVSFSPDGKLLASGGEESKIRIFDLAAGSQLGELKEHSAAVTSIAWSADGSRLASCCADGSVRVFNVHKLSGNSGTSGTSTTSPSSSGVSSKPAVSNPSGCKRCVKTFFNDNDNVSCIGSS